MAIAIARLEVGQAATILNAIISFMQYTLGLAVVAVLTKIISNVHSANTWSVIARELQSSLWPTILRTDSSSCHIAPRVKWFSRVGIFLSLLVAVAGVISPLGLSTGPLIASRNFRLVNAIYVQDTSPLASATPSRGGYTYSRYAFQLQSKSTSLYSRYTEPMAITIARLEVEKAATILNAIISFIQYTLGLAIVAILTKIISNVHSANTWSVIARELQSSLWPTLLRTDSSSSHISPRVAWLSKLGILSSLLVAVAGVISPLGLKSGPLVASHNLQPMNAVYVPDTSPLASATPSRSSYIYSRRCGFDNYAPCPGNVETDTVNINPPIIEQFNSTSHAPFNMQFRQYYWWHTRPDNLSTIKGSFSTLQSFILRDDIFAVEGAIVDLTDTPGIGLTNHTMPPSIKYGATWSQELLWLEPSTECVDTNLTIDYSLATASPSDLYTFYLTDRGGFVNLTTKYPQVDYHSGQSVNLYQHAYKGAVLSNYYSMIALNNLTRNQSSIGKSYLLKTRDDATIWPGAMQTFSLTYLKNATDYLEYTTDAGLNALDIVCEGYGTHDIANISTVGVHCGAFLSPPYRSDGGDDKLQDIGSNWRQNLYVCASATKASIQRVNYSLNGTANLANLKFDRSPMDRPVVWGVEKTDMRIIDADLYWGRVADPYEFDANLATIRADHFYIPASAADSWDSIVYEQAHTVPAAAWGYVFTQGNRDSSIVDYSGLTNAALLKKYQTIISSNHTQGFAHICNLIWTDLVVNNLIGTDTRAFLSVAEYHPSITYDLKYAIPLILLIIIWLPFFAIASIFLASGALKLSNITDILNHISVGRIVTGHSDLAVKVLDDEKPGLPVPLEANEDWGDTAGQIPLCYIPHQHAKGSSEELVRFVAHRQSRSFITDHYAES